MPKYINVSTNCCTYIRFLINFVSPSTVCWFYYVHDFSSSHVCQVKCSVIFSCVELTFYGSPLLKLKQLSAYFK